MLRATAIHIACLSLLGGCSAAAVNTGTGQASFYIEGGSGLAAVLVTGIMAGAMIEDARNWQPPAEMAPDRTVSEVDCTKPLPEVGGNLKCIGR